jgi:hypothetical protein
VQPTTVPELARTRGTCSYRLRPETRRCGTPATIHLLLYSDGWGIVGLSTCDDHVHLARAAGRLLGEHRYSSTCGHPQARWSEFPHDPTRSECVAPALMAS